MIHRLTDILKDKFGLNEDYLTEAQQVRSETGHHIGQILVDQKNLKHPIWNAGLVETPI